MKSSPNYIGNFLTSLHNQNLLNHENENFDSLHVNMTVFEILNLKRKISRYVNSLWDEYHTATKITAAEIVAFHGGFNESYEVIVTAGTTSWTAKLKYEAFLDFRDELKKTTPKLVLKELPSKYKLFTMKIMEKTKCFFSFIHCIFKF